MDLVRALPFAIYMSSPLKKGLEHRPHPSNPSWNGCWYVNDSLNETLLDSANEALESANETLDLDRETLDSEREGLGLLLLLL